MLSFWSSKVNLMILPMYITHLILPQKEKSRVHPATAANSKASISKIFLVFLGSGWDSYGTCNLCTKREGLSAPSIPSILKWSTVEYGRKILFRIRKEKTEEASFANSSKKSHEADTVKALYPEGRRSFLIMETLILFLRCNLLPIVLSAPWLCPISNA